MTSDPQLSILFAEDEAGARELSAFILEAAGYRVLTATNGNVAYTLLNKDPAIDLLISDINMPGGISGIELALRAHEARGELPIILTSGHDQNSFEDFPDNTGFLPKPYDRRDLLAAVHAALPRGARHH